MDRLLSDELRCRPRLVHTFRMENCSGLKKWSSVAVAVNPAVLIQQQDATGVSVRRKHDSGGDDFRIRHFLTPFVWRQFPKPFRFGVCLSKVKFGSVWPMHDHGNQMPCFIRVSDWRFDFWLVHLVFMPLARLFFVRDFKLGDYPNLCYGLRALAHPGQIRHRSRDDRKPPH